MRLLKKYLSRTLQSSFFPIFLSLFTITSVVFLVKIAALTSVITITFGELAYLYLLKVPVILYYTLPITFFIAMVLNLSKLSGEYELIVISSFGFSPLRLLFILLPVSFLASAALFVISFVLIPQTDYLEDKFVTLKKQEAEFNIKPSEYGQIFGPWFIYVEGKDGGIYKDVTLFEPNLNKDTFVMAKEANIQNEQNALKLELSNGVAMNISTNKFQQIDFEKMMMRYKTSQAEEINTIEDLITYWSKIDPTSPKKRTLIQNIFISLFPLISLLFYVAFGFYNPRYEKNKNTIYAIVLTTIYMISMQKVAEMKNIDLIYIFVGVWVFLSYTTYRVKVKPYY